MAGGEAAVSEHLPLRELATRYPGRRATLYRVEAGDAVPVMDYGMLAVGETRDEDFSFASRELYMLVMPPEQLRK